MKNTLILVFSAAFYTLAGLAAAQEPTNPPPPRAGLTITAAEFPDGGVIEGGQIPS